MIPSSNQTNLDPKFESSKKRREYTNENPQNEWLFIVYK